MFRISTGPAAVGVMLVICALIASPRARAEDDYLATLLGAFRGASPSPSLPLPFANGGGLFAPQRHAPRARSTPYGGSLAFCVRTCDGRYFPATGSDRQSRAEACSSFCPASKTEIVYGSNIDNAATENGRAYSELPNAFRYRNELVAGCTCNGKDEIGLARVKIEDDPTLRKGDIVAGPNGLMVAGRSADRRGASLHFSPASKSVVSQYRQLPVVAAE
jgi:Protein of unknown function (DUF2865)